MNWKERESFLATVYRKYWKTRDREKSREKEKAIELESKFNAKVFSIWGEKVRVRVREGEKVSERESACVCVWEREKKERERGKRARQKNCQQRFNFHNILPCFLSSCLSFLFHLVILNTECIGDSHWVTARLQANVFPHLQISPKRFFYVCESF